MALSLNRNVVETSTCFYGQHEPTTRRSNATTGIHYVRIYTFLPTLSSPTLKIAKRHVRRTSLAHRSLEKLYSSWLPKLLTTPKGRAGARRSSSSLTSLRAGSEPSGRFRPSMQSPSCSAKLQHQHKKKQGRQRSRVRSGYRAQTRRCDGKTLGMVIGRWVHSFCQAEVTIHSPAGERCRDSYREVFFFGGGLTPQSS